MDPTPGRVVLLRHGQTEWSTIGRHTGRTDLPLTAEGEREAVAAAAILARFDISTVLASPLARAQRTAALAGFPEFETVPDLAEWDYGPVEGHTREEVAVALGRPWRIWSDGVRLGGVSLPQVAPAVTHGEALEDVAARASRLVDRAEALTRDGRDVLLVGHGHILRIFAAVWLRADPTLGEHLHIETAGVSAVGFHSGARSLLRWNLLAGGRV